MKQLGPKKEPRIGDIFAFAGRGPLGPDYRQIGVEHFLIGSY